MRTRATGFMITALLASAIFGQAQTTTAAAMQDRLLHLNHAETVQQFQEMTNAVRTLTEVRDLSADNEQMSLAVRGNSEQIGLAEWLVKQLDQPVEGTASPLSPEYRGLSDTDEQHLAITNGVARVFYLTYTANVQDFQEAANAIRSVTETRRVATVNQGKAMLVRGTPTQMAMVEWLVQSLDPDRQKTSSTAGEYTVGADDVMRVFSIANAKAVPEFQEIANGIRSMAYIRRIVTLNTPRSIVVRSAPDQMAMAEWLLGEVDKPAGERQSQASSDYRVPDSAYALAAAKSPHDDIVRVFHLAHAAAPEDLKRDLAQVTEGRNVFTYDSQHALVVRGTPSQMALAEKLIHDLDLPTR